MDKNNVALRLKDNLSERLDAEIARLKQTQPGAGWSRSGVCRMALELYLRGEEQKAATEDASATG